MGSAVNLVDRLEARWRDVRAAWAHLQEARADRRAAIDRVRQRIRDDQQALDELLRIGDAADAADHLSACHDCFVRIEAARRHLDTTRKKHDAIVGDREAAFEALLHTEQLPLFADAPLAMTGSVVVDGHLVRVGERLWVRGRGVATVEGFRTVDGGVEVVVLSPDDGQPFEAIAAVLSRDDMEPPAEPVPAPRAKRQRHPERRAR